MAKKTQTVHDVARKRFIGGGGGVYRCGVCKRNTRAVDLDAKGTDLCHECFTLAGIENTISDNGEDSEAAMNYFDEAREMLAKLRKFGIDASKIWSSVIAVVEKPKAIAVPAELVPVMARFLKYGFHDIDYMWNNLTKEEKTFATEEEFKHLTAWLKSV